MKNFLKLWIWCLFVSSVAQAQTPIIALTNYATGFTRPVDIAHAGDARLFIVEQDGIIRIIDGTGTVLPTPFLNIDPIVGSSGNEQGLLGLVFHPDYATNGFFYVNYTNNSGNTRISRFTVTANPNIADPASELVIYAFNQDFSNHNGGDLNFGPADGYLYFGTGDGGSGGDPNNRAQNPLSPLGKMMRIDVDNPSGGLNYGIPPTNPFAGSMTVLNEIWALGLRNPWRFSFDRLTHDMFIGDVGQGSWEEIDFQPAASSGGENYGWRCYEGDHTYNTSGCGAIGNYTFPIFEYVSAFPLGCSITGGYVYRGSAFPNMVGKYFFVDYCAGNFWFLEPNGTGGWNNTFLTDLANFEYSSFGEDQGGELFVAGLNSGIIFRLVDNSIVLPIELATFNAEVVDREQVLLHWTTLTETNSAYFDVEQSKDGHNFVPIGRIEALGNSTETQRYEFTDYHPSSGISYYRLKLSDKDGQFRYSAIISVKIDPPHNGELAVYPNPVKAGDHLELLFDSQSIARKSVMIYSTTGKLLMEQDIENNQLELPVNFATGLFFITIRSDRKNLTARLLVVD